MKRLLSAYKDLLSIIYNEAPIMVVLTFLFSIIQGLIQPLIVYIKQNIFDGGLSVARGEINFSDYYIFLILFVVFSILPSIIQTYIYNYVEARSLLIFRTAYKSRMLKKMKTIKYEHLEKESSVEIIDKAYYRAEQSARHLWPMYISYFTTSVIASIGIFVIVFSIRWWLVLTILIPFIMETIVKTKQNYNIYAELETYWKKERKYTILGIYLRSRDYIKELKAFGNANWLINKYKTRLQERNREYQKYFFKELKYVLLADHITSFSSILHAIIMLIFFLNGDISIGLFIAASSLMFGGVYDNLEGCSFIFKWGPHHINTYKYYDDFFALSDEEEGSETDFPDSFDIEFKNVWFRYPETDKDILKGLTFKIKNGEKASIVGENGEGKSTMIKLLLGLFEPDSGEILIGGKNLSDFPLRVRTKLFGPVFQDFTKYSITIKENIGIGDIDELENKEKIDTATKKGKADVLVDSLDKGYETLLGRDFEGGVDVSGGEWQRIALARAFMGDKPILLLDEPTSQLDPMAEVSLYRDFASMTENKTAVFITHRLGSTMITDKIFVIKDGKISETGTHEELMLIDGVYSEMFNAQKQWYQT